MRDVHVSQNEEQKVASIAEKKDVFFRAFNKIPYNLIMKEIDNTLSDEYKRELHEICDLYSIYKLGNDFVTEGTNGDYIPAKLLFKMAASLVNKQARFLFSEEPDMGVVQKGEADDITDEDKRNLIVLNDLISTVLDKNMFPNILLKAAKDCFIGKRVACLINFNEDDGITIEFLNSLQFLYETKLGNPSIITKFVCFIIVVDSASLVDKRIFKKKYELDLDTNSVFLEEALYDGTGELVETITERVAIKIDFIPAVIFINDGLTGEIKGESEIEYLKDFEMWYSKLGNADFDAQRKSMNPTKYVVDMEGNSTRNLSTSPGALWDLGSDQNLDEAHTMVGMLEPKMSYSDALKITLDRIKTAAYEQVDMPNITNDALSGVITTGKALKAIYWPLLVRCKEKMKMWGPQLGSVIEIIINGAYSYPKIAKKYVDNTIVLVPHKPNVIQNTPLPEDEVEEKTSDLAEVESNVMSRKSYMKKWRLLTDNQVDEELRQIAYESQLIEDSAFNNGFAGDNLPLRQSKTDSIEQAGVNQVKSSNASGTVYKKNNYEVNSKRQEQM